MTGEHKVRRRRWPTAAVVCAAWTLYGAVALVQWHASREATAPTPWKWYGGAVLWLGMAWTWAMLTPLIARLVRWSRHRWPRIAPVFPHVPAVLAIHTLLYLPNALGFYFITTRWPAFGPGVQRGIVQTALLYVITALAVLALDHARLARQRAERATQLEADLARARLETLRRQLQPHFLFNTLNTIAALIETDRARAGVMVARLGELLRHSLEDHEHPLIPLAAELDFVRLYTEIEQVRFESWLRVTEAVDDLALEAHVPPMILQPLVENAIRHGVAPSQRQGNILIRAARSGGDRLLLQVIDDGAGLRADRREGVGLRATRERLWHLFGDDAHFILDAEHRTTRATIDLPFVRDCPGSAGNRRARPFGSLLLAMPLLMCSGVPGDATHVEPLRREPADLAIVDVDLIPMDTERVLERYTLLVRDGRIAALAPSAELGPETGTPAISGRGLYLLPGLIDMHVHVNAADLDAYVQNGITSVRNMWGYEQLATLIAQVDDGGRIGPRIFSLTAGFDGAPAVWPYTQISDDVTTIPGNLERQVQLGFREVKVYQRLSRAAYDTIVALATRRGLTFAGHLPGSVELRAAMDAGQRSIEHLGGFRSSSRLSEDAQYAAARGLYVCPTLEVQSVLNRGSGDAHRTAVTRELHRHGVKLLVGTDAGINATRPGASIHDELRQFVGAGISAFDALRGATTLAAEYLGQSGHIGRIAVGMEADLLLVRGNPLRDITRSREIEAVILNGRRVR